MAIYYDTPLDRTFHALGDPTRRRMLSALHENGQLTAGELGQPFNMSQPSASKHLAVLEKAGLVTRTVEGRRHSFALNADPLKEADSWISKHTAFWTGSLDRLETLVETVTASDKAIGEKKND